jgi:hypothetical protein
MRLIDKDELISRLRHASIYNKPCPEWVFELIEVFRECEHYCASSSDGYRLLEIKDDDGMGSQWVLSKL